MDWLPVVLVTLLALGFTYTNGFHDSANAVATSVTTRALTPKVALAMAAIANFLGAFFGSKVAETLGQGIIAAPQGSAGVRLCAAALIGATCWNLITWRAGLPSSSSHALIGGLGGAAIAAGGEVQWTGVLRSVAIPMLVFPLVALIVGYLVMLGILWLYRDANRGAVSCGFRLAQTVSASAMAFGHGMQDAAKVAGVIVLALTVGGYRDAGETTIPWWVLGACAIVLSAGTYAGGWRIMRTLGRRIIDLDPPSGFAAEASSAAILYVATALRAPVSTTHTIASAIIGAGGSHRPRGIRWSVVREIVLTWVLTFPAAALIAALAAGVLRLFG